MLTKKQFSKYQKFIPKYQIDTLKIIQTDKGREKLKMFRDKVCSGKLVKFYSDIGNLKASVAVALNRCIINYPAVGWIRGDSVNSDNGDEQKKDAISRQDTKSI